MTFIEYLDDLARKERENVDEYENFHGNKLADIRSLDPMDSFLYGVASGKLSMAEDLRDLVVEMMLRFENS
jgi:hypothetical protein